MISHQLNHHRQHKQQDYGLRSIISMSSSTSPPPTGPNSYTTDINGHTGMKPSTPPVPPAPPASAVSPTTPGSPALHIPELASPIHFTNDISASRVDAVNNLYRAISNLGDNHPERQHHLQHIIEGPTEHLEHSFITYLETLKVHIDTPVGRVAGAEDAIKHRMPGGVMTVIMLLLLGLWLGLGLGFGFGYEVGLVLGQQSMLKAFLAGA